MDRSANRRNGQQAEQPGLNGTPEPVRYWVEGDVRIGQDGAGFRCIASSTTTNEAIAMRAAARIRAREDWRGGMLCRWANVRVIASR